jgi:hypothetical protein
MMLDLYQRHAGDVCVPLSPPGRGIVRVKIADNHLGCESIELAEVLDGSLEGIARFGRIEIADVLTEPDLSPKPIATVLLRCPPTASTGRKS